MKTLKEPDYTINICSDVIEWAKEFYNMPDCAILGNEEEVSNECMGFANIDKKEIWIFVPKFYSLKYATNFKQIEANDEFHESKADYYMNFYLLVDKIFNDITNLLSGKLKMETEEQPLKLYEFLYNGMTEESSYATISLHRTREGAEKALIEHKEKERLEYEEYKKRLIEGWRQDADFKEEDIPDLMGTLCEFDRFKDWTVNEVDVLD